MFDDDDEMFEEFKLEAAEMFEQAEEGLLAIGRGEDFESQYNSVFRVLHSLKGASGMFGLTDLQAHMHKLESLFEQCKNLEAMPETLLDYFLNGVDTGKLIFEGEEVDFSYLDSIDGVPADAVEQKAPQQEEASTEIINEESAEVEVAKIAEPSVRENIKIVPSVEAIVKKEKKVFRINAATKNKLIKSENAPHTVSVAIDKGLVYVVDDSADICEILTVILEGDGFTVESFTNPLLALKKIEVQVPDAVLTDYKMPEMSGMQLIDSIEEMKLNIPILLISGHLSKELLLEGMGKGVFNYIEKPFENEIILNMCKSAVVKSKTSKLLNKSVDYILYMFSDLDIYLKEQGKENVRNMLKKELEDILKLRKFLLHHK